MADTGDDLAGQFADTEEPAYLTLLWDDDREEWEMHTKLPPDEIAAALSWVLMKMAAGEWNWDHPGEDAN